MIFWPYKFTFLKNGYKNKIMLKDQCESSYKKIKSKMAKYGTTRSSMFSQKAYPEVAIELDLVMLLDRGIVSYCQKSDTHNTTV